MAKTTVDAAANKFVAYLIAESKTAKVSKLKNHDAVIKLASEMGYEVTHSGLQAAMKSVVSKALTTKGIPKWVIDRMSMPVHD
jgi:hypothetical protein